MSKSPSHVKVCIRLISCLLFATAVALTACKHHMSDHQLAESSLDTGDFLQSLERMSQRVDAIDQSVDSFSNDYTAITRNFSQDQLDQLLAFHRQTSAGSSGEVFGLTENSLPGERILQSYKEIILENRQAIKEIDRTIGMNTSNQDFEASKVRLNDAVRSLEEAIAKLEIEMSAKFTAEVKRFGDLRHPRADPKLLYESGARIEALIVEWDDLRKDIGENTGLLQEIHAAAEVFSQLGEKLTKDAERSRLLSAERVVDPKKASAVIQSLRTDSRHIALSTLPLCSDTDRRQWSYEEIGKMKLTHWYINSFRSQRPGTLSPLRGIVQGEKTVPELFAETYGTVEKDFRLYDFDTVTLVYTQTTGLNNIRIRPAYSVRSDINCNFEAHGSPFSLAITTENPGQFELPDLRRESSHRYTLQKGPKFEIGTDGEVPVKTQPPHSRDRNHIHNFDFPEHTIYKATEIGEGLLSFFNRKDTKTCVKLNLLPRCR